MFGIIESGKRLVKPNTGYRRLQGTYEQDWITSVLLSQGFGKLEQYFKILPTKHYAIRQMSVHQQK